MSAASEPLVSVIIPAYNRATVLGEAIDSALGQTHRRLEVIVVDDGSTDGSAGVAAGYEDPRVHVLVRSNGGIGAARNTGVVNAGGQILAFLDSDDRWAPDKLERQLARLAQQPDLDGVYGFVQEFGDGAARDGGATRNARAPLPSATILRRMSFERVGPFATGWRLGEWVEWWARASEAGLRFEAVGEAVTFRRVDGDNQGFREAQERADYLHILKEALDRRRAAAARSRGTSEG